jgi:phosphatidylserine/phosphatidylglycerophosphate/cardiolipin synthase-like enzyme
MDLVVVTNPVAGPWRLAYGGAYYAARAARTLAALRPGFTLYRLLACGRVGARVRYVAVELHAKVMIVDDQWCTVGSANLNERSIHSEFEANVAIEDARFAQRLRVALMAEHLGLGPDDGRLADMAGAAALWRERAAANAAARRAGTLADGLAHPFEQQPAWRWLRGRARWF